VEIAAIRFPVIIRWRAIGRLYHAVVHNFVPILPRHYAKEHRHAGNRWFEISSSKKQRDYFWCIRRRQGKMKKYTAKEKFSIIERFILNIACIFYIFRYLEISQIVYFSHLPIPSPYFTVPKIMVPANA